MTQTTAPSSETLYPEDFFDSIESSTAELICRMQVESEAWRNKTDLSAKFQLIAFYLEQAVALLPEAGEDAS